MSEDTKKIIYSMMRVSKHYNKQPIIKDISLSYFYGAKIGVVAAGKNWLDLVHALSLLNIDAEEAERLGLTTYKVGQTWPSNLSLLPKQVKVPAIAGTFRFG